MNLASLEEAKRASTIAVYGIGIGSHFDALKGWLEQSPHHQLVFFEDDPSALKAFLESDDAGLLLNHPQVLVAELHDKEAYAVLSHDFYFLSLPAYQEKAESVYARLLQDVYSVHAYLAELWLFKEQANIYYHLAHLDEYAASKELESCFSNQSFIICGAGPSLEEHFNLLKDRKGILVASGTALNILNDFGIQADLGVAFDSKPTGARRLQSNSAFSTPFLVDLDSTEGVRYLNGPKILTKQAKLVPWKNKLLTRLGIDDQLFEIGPCISSTHYAIESAILLGASSIMLLGVDLAYIKGKKYAGKKTWLQDEEDPVPIKERTDLIEMNGSLASRLFLKEAEIFSYLAIKHPEVKFYEGSRQGQKIAGISAMDFRKWQAGLIDQKVLNKQSNFDIPLQEIQKVLLEWKEQLLTSPELLLEGYLKRLELKFAAKKRFIGNQAIENETKQFCKKVVKHHLHCLEEALKDIEEKIAFPDRDKPEDENQLDGTVKLYYSNGQPKSSIDYDNGKRNGIYRFYSRSGMLLEEGHYQKGIPIGPYKQWNRKGYLEKEIYSHPNGAFDLIEWDEQKKMIREVKSGYFFKKEVDALKESLNGLFKELS